MQAPLCVQDVKSRITRDVVVYIIIIDSRCFMSNRCDSTPQEADLDEDLVVDGETFGCVHMLCYLGYTLGERILIQQL